MVERSVNYDNIASRYDCRYKVGDWTGVERQQREFAADTVSGKIFATYGIRSECH